MSDEEEWVQAALTDDSMVVELLVRLNHATLPTKPDFPLDWTVRQPRSKTTTLKPTTTTTTISTSPTTPLSWSDATSLSCGAGGGGSGSGGVVVVDGGFEGSSCKNPKRTSDTERSKVTGTRETTTTKKSKKKKTLAELKEEEILLLKERRHLKRELETFLITLEKQRATNENLKKMKLDLQSLPAAETVQTVACKAAIPGQFQRKPAACDTLPPSLPPIVTVYDLDALQNTSRPMRFSQVQKEVRNPETKFLLPDLNLPLEENLDGVS